MFLFDDVIMIDIVLLRCCGLRIHCSVNLILFLCVVIRQFITNNFWNLFFRFKMTINTTYQPVSTAIPDTSSIGSDFRLASPGTLSNGSDLWLASPDTLSNGSAFRLSISPQWYLSYDISMLTIYIIVIICGLGNWVVAFCILATKKLRRPFNTLVVALATVYGTLTTVLAPMEMVDIVHHLLGASHAWCKIKVVLRTGVFYSSMFLILSIGVIRLIHGLKTTRLSLHMSHMVVLFVAIICVATPLTIETSLDSGIGMLICRGLFIELIWLLRHTATWAGAFIPTVVLFSSTVLAYSVLIGVLIIRERAWKRDPNSVKKRPHIVTSKVAFCVILGFSISYLTPFISKLLQVIGWSPTLNELPHNLALFNTAMYIQAATHPFIYFFETTDFKRALRRILGHCQLRRTARVSPPVQHAPNNFPNTPSVRNHIHGVNAVKPWPNVEPTIGNEPQRY